MWSVESLQWWWIYTVYQHPIDGGFLIVNVTVSPSSVIGPEIVKMWKMV